MRMIRGLALVPALALLSPATSLAQTDRGFTDSWFWGAKAGVLAFSTSRIENGFAPSVGTDWLITRNRGALYVSLDRAFFNEESSVADGQSLTGERVVNVRDLTRLSFALMAFPTQGYTRPYGGVGLALNFIQEATAADNGSGGASSLVESRIDDQSSRASFQLMLGVQSAMNSVSWFAQASMLPFENGFLLNNRPGYSLEVGLRWNLGTSIDQIK